MAESEFVKSFWESFPKGAILPFAGDIAHKPNGWELCDGSKGTVNLKDRIPMGMGDTSMLGQSNEGTATHSHTYNGTTSQPSGIDNPHVEQDDNSALNVKGVDHTHTFGGQTSTESNIPPVTRVYFIQKMR